MPIFIFYPRSPPPNHVKYLFDESLERRRLFSIFTGELFGCVGAQEIAGVPERDGAIIVSSDTGRWEGLDKMGLDLCELVLCLVIDSSRVFFHSLFAVRRRVLC